MDRTPNTAAGRVWRIALAGLSVVACSSPRADGAPSAVSPPAPPTRPAEHEHAREATRRPGTASADARPDDRADRADPATSPDQLVDITALDPTIRLDIRYATANNFTGVAVYPVARCLLRRAVAERLVRVQRALATRGLGLLVWDCYRPISVQQKFWQLVPDARYVARPVIEDGVPVSGSVHNRGAAVDATLASIADGRPVAMPTDYDDFSARAHRGSALATREQRANAATLEAAMVAEGFEPLPTEWWHFDGPGWQEYPLADEPLTGPRAATPESAETRR